MKDRDALVLLVLLVLATRSAGAGPLIVPGPGPIDERWLVDGVYWWCAGASEAQQLIAWFADNSDKVRLHRMLGTNGGDCAVVLFQVSERIRWPLSGTPEEAPYGLDTDLDDLRGESKLAEFFRRMAERTVEQIKAFDARVQQWLQQVIPPPP